MKTLSALLMGAMCAAFMACEAGSSEDQEVDSETQSIRDATNPSNSTYFTIRRDFRKCAAPACGGYFVKRVNRALTVCADRVARAECFVADLDLALLLLSPTGEAELRANARQFLLRGKIVENIYGTFGNLGLFRATEASRGHGGVRPTGTYYRVKDNGIVCITFPCLSLTAERLNSDLAPKAIAGVNIEGIGETSIDGAAQLRKPGGLLLTALPTTVTGPAGNALALNATEFYIPFTVAKDGGNDACGSRGLKSCGTGQFCSFPDGANCGRADAPGVCALRPEICPQIYLPVCGCDGQTYGNSCQAASAGVSVSINGPC